MKSKLQMKIYLDNCCYNRPFDNQSQGRIRLESEAILSILQMALLNDVIIVGSEILEVEISQMKDDNKRQKVREIYKAVSLSVRYTEALKERAAQIMAISKIKLFDSLHIAAAEAAGARVLLTTDDKLINMSAGLGLQLKVINPLKFAWELMFKC